MKNPLDSLMKTLVIGGTGKTGSRIVERLRAKSVPTRVACRSAEYAFDWKQPESWDKALNRMEAVYLNYAPDLAVPGADKDVALFIEKAKAAGVKRIVILSGRGEEGAQNCEKIVQNSGLEWTVVRASWFNQNFSEGDFLPMILNGAITLPAGDIPEPFIDVDDIADVAVAALTEAKHSGEVYEVSGPRLMTFKDVATELSNAIGREINFIDIPHQSFLAALQQEGMPEAIAWLMDYLFGTVLDGRNAYVSDGVQRALGREPKDFSDYAKEVAAKGLWRVAA